MTTAGHVAFHVNARRAALGSQATTASADMATFVVLNPAWSLNLVAVVLRGVASQLSPLALVELSRRDNPTSIPGDDDPVARVLRHAAPGTAPQRLLGALTDTHKSAVASSASPVEGAAAFVAVAAQALTVIENGVGHPGHGSRTKRRLMLHNCVSLADQWLEGDRWGGRDRFGHCLVTGGKR